MSSWKLPFCGHLECADHPETCPDNGNVCSMHGDLLIWEEGGPDKVTLHGRWYCPTCQESFMRALDQSSRGETYSLEEVAKELGITLPDDMTEDEFFEKHKPIESPSGSTIWQREELVVNGVSKYPDNQVWTYVCDEADGAIAGWHVVNNCGYIVTEVPWVDGGESMTFDDTSEGDEDDDIDINDPDQWIEVDRPE